MKKLFKKLALMVVALLTFSVGSNYTVKEVRAADSTYSYTFTAKQFSSNGTKTLNGVDWTLSGNGGYWGLDSNGKGQQFGSGSKPYKSMTLTSTNFSNVSKIVINTSGASSINASFTASVAGTQIDSSKKLTTSATDYTFELSEPKSGPVCFTYTQTSSKAIYIKSISVVYSEAAQSNIDLIKLNSTTASLGFDYSLHYEDVATECFTKVNDATELSIGDSIVIVSNFYNYAMSTTQNTNNRGVIEVTKNGETIGTHGNIQVIELEAGAVENTFAFNVGNGYLYASSSSSNYLKTTSTIDENSSWSILIEDGIALIKTEGTYTRNIIKYNKDSALFSCYGSSTSLEQADVNIYKLSESETKVKKLVSSSFDNISILFGAEVEISLFEEFSSISAGVKFYSGNNELFDTGANKVVPSTNFDGDSVYSVGSIFKVFADGEFVSDETKSRLSQDITAAVYFVVDGEEAILLSKTISVYKMVNTYINDMADNATVKEHKEALDALKAYIEA